MAGDDAAQKRAVPDRGRGVVRLDDARVSRHLTEREQNEAATWEAWGALQIAWDEYHGRTEEILARRPVIEGRPDGERVRACMATVLACGQRLLAADQLIADDARRAQ